MINIYIYIYIYVFTIFNICIAVFELLEKGEVMELPTESPLSEATAWAYMRDVVLGVEYCKNPELNISVCKPWHPFWLFHGEVKNL